MPDRLEPRRPSRAAAGGVRRRAARARLAAVAAASALLAASGCATAAVTGSAGAKIRVVAAESAWGSIAAQLGGDKAEVAAVVTNPNTDPHDYEPTAADARAVASARLVVINGLGYDAWASKLVAANPAGGRVVLNVGSVVGAPADANPHRWYDPADVHAVVAAITAGYQRVDPKDAAYFAALRDGFESRALAEYDGLLSQLRSKYQGTPVGASESIFTMLASNLGLDLVTPPAFLRAVSQGTEPTASDKQTIDRQLRSHAIDVYVYNSQNATPDVRAQVAEARSAGIPVTTITETLAPATATFQDWQVAQLRSLQTALAKGTGR